MMVGKANAEKTHLLLNGVFLGFKTKHLVKTMVVFNRVWKHNPGIESGSKNPMFFHKFK